LKENIKEDYVNLNLTSPQTKKKKPFSEHKMKHEKPEVAW
jgi:hypothetical protein